MPFSLLTLLFLSFLPLFLTGDTPTSNPQNEGASSSFSGPFGPLSRDGLTVRPAREGGRPPIEPSRMQSYPPVSPVASREHEITCHEGVWDLQAHTKNTQPFETDCKAIFSALTARSPLQRRTSRGDYWWYRRKDYCQITVVLLPSEALQSALLSQLRMQDSIWELVLYAMQGILMECVEARGLGGYYYFDEEKAKFKVTIGESPTLMVYEEENQEEPLLGSRVTYQPSSATSCPSALEQYSPPRQPSGMIRNRPAIFPQGGTSMRSMAGSAAGQPLIHGNSISSPTLNRLESQTPGRVTHELQRVWSSTINSLRTCCSRLDCCGCCDSPCWRDPNTWTQIAVFVNLFAATMNAIGNTMNVVAAAQNLRSIEKNHPGCQPCLSSSPASFPPANG